MRASAVGAQAELPAEPARLKQETRTFNKITLDAQLETLILGKDASKTCTMGQKMSKYTHTTEQKTSELVILDMVLYYLTGALKILFNSKKEGKIYILYLSRPSSEVHDWNRRGCSQRGRSRSGTVRMVRGVSPSSSRHSAIKRMHYSVGVRSIGRIANDPPKVGRAVDYVAAAPWPPLGSPGCGWLLCERLTH